MRRSIILLVALFIKQSLSYPESGFLVHLGSEQGYESANRWQSIAGWTAKFKGSFLSDFKQSGEKDSLNSIIVSPRSGFYFVSIHLQMNNVSPGTYSLKLCSKQDQVWRTRAISQLIAENESSFTLEVSSLLQLHTEEQLRIYVRSDRTSWVLSELSAISIQYTCSINNFVGFLAQPGKSTIPKARAPIHLTHWTLQKSNINGFAKITGSYTSMVSGFYLINANMIYKTYENSVTFYLFVDGVRKFHLTRYVIQKKSKTQWVSTHLTHILQVQEKSKIELKVASTNRKTHMSNNSTYSIVLLAKSSDVVRNPSTFKVIDEGRFDSFRSNRWIEIDNWNRTKKKRGTFLISESSYYFVMLKLSLVSSHTSSVHAAISVGGALWKINMGSILVQPSIHKSDLFIASVVKFIKGDHIASYIKSEPGSTVTILPGSSFMLFQVPASTPSYISSLYHNGGAKRDQPTRVSLKNVDFESNYVSVDKMALLTVKHGGIYLVILYLSTQSPQFSFVQAEIRMGKARKWKTIATMSSDTDSCMSLAIVRQIPSYYSLQIWFKCFDAFGCLPRLESSLSINLIKQTRALEGISVKLRAPEVVGANSKSHLFVWELDKSIGTFNESSNFNPNNGDYIVKQSGIYLVAAVINLHPNTSLNTSGEVHLSLRRGMSNKNSIRSIRRVTNLSVKEISVCLYITVNLKESERIRIEVENKFKFGSWKLIPSSYLAVVFLSNEPGFLVVKQGATQVDKTKISAWSELSRTNPSARNPSDYDNSFYRFQTRSGMMLARKSFLALVCVSVTGTMISDPHSMQMAKIKLQRKGKLIANDMHAHVKISKPEKVHSMLKFTLQFAGVVHVKSDDHLAVLLNMTSQFEFDVGTTFSLVILTAPPERPSLIGQLSSKPGLKSPSIFPELQTGCRYCYLSGFSNELVDGKKRVIYTGQYLASVVVDYETSSMVELIIHTSKLKHTILRLGSSLRRSSKSSMVTMYLQHGDLVSVDIIGDRDTFKIHNASFALAYLDDMDQTKYSEGKTELSLVEESFYMLILTLETKPTKKLLSLTLHDTTHDVVVWTYTNEKTQSTINIVVLVRVYETTNVRLTSNSFSFIKSTRIQALPLQTGKHNYLISAKTSEESLHCTNGSQKWDILDTWIDRNGTLSAGFLTVTEQGEYIISLTLLTSSASTVLRNIVLVLDGDFYSSNMIDISQEANEDQQVAHTITRVIHLQAHQTLSVYVNCHRTSDLTISQGSTIQIYLKEKTLPDYSDDFPAFNVQPTPKYVNTSMWRNWTCEAQGRGKLIYEWQKIDLHTGKLSKEVSGENITLEVCFLL